MKIKIYTICLLLLSLSCTNSRVNTKNKTAADQEATYQLVMSGEKQFSLDTETKVKPPYMQLVEEADGRRILTFLNQRTNAIYFYNYTDTSYIKNIQYNREGADAILRVSAYFIKSPDSIYIYNMPKVEVLLTNGEKQIERRISLMGPDANWPLYYPQYYLGTVNPMMKAGDKLYISGFSPFSLPDSLVHRFRHTTFIDMQTNQTDFQHTYPADLFGGKNWGGDLSMLVYPALLADGTLVHSYPVSPDLYIRHLGDTTVSTVYAGSKEATEIRPIDHELLKTTNEQMIVSYLEQDQYGPILHDPYRNLYYRYYFKPIPGTTPKTPINKKPFAIILLDEEFNYLGETNIGAGDEWNWQNSFVTSEGLNIEYTGEESDDDHLILKIFTPEKL